MIFRILIIMIVCLLLTSCNNNEIMINDYTDKSISLHSLDIEYVVIYSKYTCKDCLNDLLQKLQKKEKRFITLFPSDSYNNLTKSIFLQLSEINGVPQNSIYWIESDKYEKLFKDESSPFILKKQQTFVKISYHELFNSDGKVVHGIID